MQSEFDLEFNLKADTVSVIRSMFESTIQVDFSFGKKSLHNELGS